jgi:hypothetical protein
LKDDITPRLIEWIKDPTTGVPPPPSPDDINQFYIIIPPRQTHIETYNDSKDPHGFGIQGFHNEGRTNPPAPPTYYWFIVKTEDALDPIYLGDLNKAEVKEGGLDFVGGVSGTPNSGAFGIAKKVCHEFVEQCADRNGSFRGSTSAAVTRHRLA